MATLRDWMHPDAMPELPANVRKLLDRAVVREHSPSRDGDAYRPWPGKHMNVWGWVEVEGGLAVGHNESPSRGWSFPVIRAPKES